MTCVKKQRGRGERGRGPHAGSSGPGKESEHGEGACRRADCLACSGPAIPVDRYVSGLQRPGFFQPILQSAHFFLTPNLPVFSGSPLLLKMPAILRISLAIGLLVMPETRGIP